MLYYIFKILISVAVVVAVSEIAKRSSGFAALIASLPLTSLLAFVWLHVEGSSAAELGELSGQIFWLVLPSLLLFVIFPLCLKHGMGFWVALSLSAGVTAGGYFVLIAVLRRLGIPF
jgi:hypothetical protein